MTDQPVLPAGYTLIAFDEIHSTNLAALERITAGAASDRQVIWAKRQTAGRGRQGRAWHSPDGNLFVSAVYEMIKPLDETAQLGFAASLAAAETIDRLLPADNNLPVTCKWPNDVLVTGKKAVGILLETRSFAPTEDNIGFVVVGIGINLADAPADTPYPATSLTTVAGTNVDAEEALSVLIQRLEYWYERWASGGVQDLREAWLSRAEGVGKPITVKLANREVSGIFAGIDETGALVLANDGDKTTISAGDVYFPATA